MSALKPYSCLQPLASIYEAITGLRERAYQVGLCNEYRAKLPVICVGNIIAGGSGKTSFAAYLAQGLLARGHRPVILSRGYKGQHKKPHRVRETDTVYEVGDEALMNFSALPREIPIVVSQERVAGAQYIEQQKFGNVIILDDGYQHYALARDVNLLMVDLSSARALENWQQGRLLPAGYFRETKKHGVKKADAILLLNKNDALNLAEPSKYLGEIDKPVFCIGYGSARLEDVHSGEVKPLTSLLNTEVSVACALADPQSFEDSLSKFGAQIVKRYIYPDHHYYTQNDWDRISVRPPVIVTEKDAIKLGKYINREALCFKLAREIAFKVEAHTSQFWQMIELKINKKSA
ncbi:MAG: tetraacyldisaccharide 4'-kinase [Deltaproteobacteria bacterium]|nr:tetraacyldisaccharide 4'-kinase [Deltaproteobacteria bacterium]